MIEKHQRLWDYLILCACLLLAYVFLDYGIGKLTGHQFGLTAAELSGPVKDLNLFRLSWYLFDQEPFKTFIGISQIVAALLLLFNRTVIIGALLFLPILANILVVDITYLKDSAFYWRLVVLLSFAGFSNSLARESTCFTGIENYYFKNFFNIKISHLGLFDNTLCHHFFRNYGWPAADNY